MLVENGTVHTKPSDLSRIMNEFFVNKVAHLRNNLPLNQGDPLVLVQQLMVNINSFFQLQSVHPDQVLKIISNLKSSSSCGLDSIDSRVIKLAKHQLVPVITHVINLSIVQRTFPSPWKASKVVPLHKKDEVIYPKNYRPVSLLPVISKVLERVIFDQMINYLEANHLLHPSHHGFRSKHSTVTALIEMYDQWIEAFEKDEVSAAVMLDLSAAFDVVDHDILIQKLALYGFGECSTSWLRSYLTCRSQRVYVEGSLSEPLLLEAGVPQGSILGPLLYVIFTNDLAEVVHGHPPQGNHDQPHPQVDEAAQVQAGEDHDQQLPMFGQGPKLSPYYNLNCHNCGGLSIFADDSTFTMSNTDTEQLTVDIKNKYKVIAEYMGKNKLILNSDKTHLLVLTSARNHRLHGNFNITLDTGNEIIEPRSEERLLGGIISSNLKWNSHVQDHQKSLSKILTSKINALSKISAYSSFRTRKTIANGVVMSYLTYLVQLYGGCSEYLLTGLQVQQNKAARLVTRLGWGTPTSIILLQCGWLSVRQMVVHHSLLLLFKCKQTGKPEYIYSKINHKFTRVTRLATFGGIKDDRRFESSLAQNSFIPRTVKLWNEKLPETLRAEISLTTFKEKLKTWVKNNVHI